MENEILIPGSGRPYVEGDRLDQGAPLVQLVTGVLSAEECADLIATIDRLEPTVAPITTPRGPVMRTDLRNNERVMFEEPGLARDLFERVSGVIAPRLCGRAPVGANERFRCYRYGPGQRFAPHFDGAFTRDQRERSMLTLMFYLNEGFTGGATVFHDWDVSVAPRTGAALIFQHALLHEGCEVISGTKYVLRTDVMYAL